MKTEYKIASTHKEWKECHSLMDNDDELAYPTVMAVRDGKTIGMISTASGEQNLFASYIIANSMFTCIGLYEQYDEAMKNMGIDHYLFNIEKENTKMINAIEKLFNIKPFGESDKMLFYVRRI